MNERETMPEITRICNTLDNGIEIVLLKIMNDSFDIGGNSVRLPKTHFKIMKVIKRQIEKGLEDA